MEGHPIRTRSPYALFYQEEEAKRPHIPYPRLDIAHDWNHLPEEEISKYYKKAEKLRARALEVFNAKKRIMDTGNGSLSGSPPLATE